MRALLAIKRSIVFKEGDCDKKTDVTELPLVRTWAKNMNFKVGEKSLTGLEIYRQVF